MASLFKLIKDDFRRRQMTGAELKLEDILQDIEKNPAQFTVASSLSDDRTWLHFTAQHGAPGPLQRLMECGSDVHARDAVRSVIAGFYDGVARRNQPARGSQFVTRALCPLRRRRLSGPRCIMRLSTRQTMVQSAVGF